MKSLPVFTAAQAVLDPRNPADGGTHLDQAAPRGGYSSNAVPTDASGMAFARSARQALSMVHLGGPGSGAFLRAGVNGLIA